MDLNRNPVVFLWSYNNTQVFCRPILKPSRLCVFTLKTINPSLAHRGVSIQTTKKGVVNEGCIYRDLDIAISIVIAYRDTKNAINDTHLDLDISQKLSWSRSRFYTLHTVVVSMIVLLFLGGEGSPTNHPMLRETIKFENIILSVLILRKPNLPRLFIATLARYRVKNFCFA